MKRYQQLVSVMVSGVALLYISACTGNYGQYQQTNKTLPAIPEISRPVIQRPAKVARKMVVKPKVYRPQVKKYSVDKPAEPVITQKEVAAVLSKEELIQKAQKEATVDIDPYASVPDSSDARGVIKSTVEMPKNKHYQSSTALKTLLLKARADLAVGNSQSAITSLERGLRIESQNPQAWHLLAQAHYDQSNYQQSISMAKKSIRYSADSELTGKNWALIKKAGERSGDTVVVKEALNYFKLNP